VTRRRVLAALATLLLALLPARAAAARIAVVANDDTDNAGTIRVLAADAPWAEVKPPLVVGADSVVQERGRKLYVLSRRDGSVAVIAKHDWEIRRTLALGTQHPPEDIAVIGRRRAYVTRQGVASLLRLDPKTGQASEVVDLSAFADDDGVPDLGAMLIAGDRLFVQIRRANENAPGGLQSPAYLAVVDLASETLVDANLEAAGVQGIELAGTAPKHRMQAIGQTLLVSATGGFFDAGGIEIVDLATLQSEGIAIAEADGETGADLGPFAMTSASSGFLVYSTDLDLSSHLKRFSFEHGVEKGPELHVSVGYAVPAIAHDPRSGNLFVPESIFGSRGVHVFAADSGQRLTQQPLGTGGRPTDLLLLRAPALPAGDDR